MYQSAPDLSMGRSMSMSLGREGRPRGGSRVVSKTPKLGQADLGASTTQSELGPGQLVIARPLALGPRRSRERATVRFVKFGGKQIRSGCCRYPQHAPNSRRRVIKVPAAEV